MSCKSGFTYGGVPFVAKPRDKNGRAYAAWEYFEGALGSMERIVWMYEGHWIGYAENGETLTATWEQIVKGLTG